MDTTEAKILIIFLLMTVMPLVGAILLNIALLDTKGNHALYYRFTVKYPFIILLVALLCFAVGFFLRAVFQNGYYLYFIGLFLIFIVVFILAGSNSFYDFIIKTQNKPSIDASKKDTLGESTTKIGSLSLMVKFTVAKIREAFINLNIFMVIMAIISMFSLISASISNLYSSVNSLKDLLNIERAMIFDLMGNLLGIIISAVILYGLFKKHLKEDTVESENEKL